MAKKKIILVSAGSSGKNRVFTDSNGGKHRHKGLNTAIKQGTDVVFKPKKRETPAIRQGNSFIRTKPNKTSNDNFNR